MSGVCKAEKGQRFGKLKFVNEIGVFKGNRVGKFICDCGNECEKVIANVVGRKTRSCGCKYKSIYKSSPNFTPKVKYVSTEKQEGMFSWSEYNGEILI